MTFTESVRSVLVLSLCFFVGSAYAQGAPARPAPFLDAAAMKKALDSHELLLGERIAVDIKTEKTGDLTAKAVGNECFANPCHATGCAQCADLKVYLPLGAQVLSVRYYTTAWNNAGDTPIRQILPGEIDGWAAMDAAIQYSTPTNTVVSTTFHNRSSDRNRLARLEVDWRP